MTGIILMAAAMLNPTVSVRCDQPNGWTFDVSEREESAGVRLVTVRAACGKASSVPQFKVDVSVPQIDCDFAWNPNFGCAENMTILPWWGGVFSIARTQPLRVLFSRNGRTPTKPAASSAPCPFSHTANARMAAVPTV